MFTGFIERKFGYFVESENGKVESKSIMLTFRHITPMDERNATENGLMGNINKMDPVALAMFLYVQLTNASKEAVSKLSDNTSSEPKPHEVLSMLFGTPVPWGMLRFFYELRGEEEDFIDATIEQLRSNMLAIVKGEAPPRPESKEKKKTLLSKYTQQ